jgi:1,4-dihydroxy-2-naphthoyl-CoA synthase
VKQPGLVYMTEEAKEGRNAFWKKRKPNFEKKMVAIKV